MGNSLKIVGRILAILGVAALIGGFFLPYFGGLKTGGAASDLLGGMSAEITPNDSESSMFNLVKSYGDMAGQGELLKMLGMSGEVYGTLIAGIATALCAVLAMVMALVGQGVGLLITDLLAGGGLIAFNLIMKGGLLGVAYSLLKSGIGFYITIAGVGAALIGAVLLIIGKSQSNRYG